MFLEPEQLLAEQPASHDSVACKTMSSVCFLEFEEARQEESGFEASFK